MLSCEPVYFLGNTSCHSRSALQRCSQRKTDESCLVTVMLSMLCLSLPALHLRRAELWVLLREGTWAGAVRAMGALISLWDCTQDQAGLQCLRLAPIPPFKLSKATWRNVGCSTCTNNLGSSLKCRLMEQSGASDCKHAVSCHVHVECEMCFERK